MNEAPNLSAYEKAFAKSDKTGAILVVQGKKLHVQKAILSYYSEFFDKLFNSDFKEKSMEEIPIEDVNFEDFATILSLVQDKPIIPKVENAEKLLKLADRFLLPCARRHLELFLISTASLDRSEKIRIADMFGLEKLLEHAVSLYKYRADHQVLHRTNTFHNLSAKTKVKLFFAFLQD